MDIEDVRRHRPPQTERPEEKTPSPGTPEEPLSTGYIGTVPERIRKRIARSRGKEGV